MTPPSHQHHTPNRILFIGRFADPNSTNRAFARALEERGHAIERLDYDRLRHRSRRTPLGPIRAELKRRWWTMIDHPLARAALPSLSYGLPSRKLLARLVKRRVSNFRPDWLILAKTPELDYRTLDHIDSQPNTWYFFVDPPSTMHNRTATRYAARATVASATFRAVADEFRHVNPHTVTLREGVDDSIFHSAGTERLPCVLFVGNADSYRRRIVEAFTRRDVPLYCYGTGWARGRMTPEGLPDAYRRFQIVLNLSREGGGFSARVFHAMACGALVVSDYSPDLAEVFTKGHEVDWFHGPEEAASLIEGYLRHPERLSAVAEAGRHYVHTHQTWDHVAARMESIMRSHETRQVFMSPGFPRYSA